MTVLEIHQLKPIIGRKKKTVERFVTADAIRDFFSEAATDHSVLISGR